MKLINTIGAGITGMSLLVGNVQGSRTISSNSALDEISMSVKEHLEYDGEHYFSGFSASRFTSKNKTRYLFYTPDENSYGNKLNVVEFDYKIREVTINGKRIGFLNWNGEIVENLPTVLLRGSRIRALGESYKNGGVK